MISAANKCAPTIHLLSSTKAPTTAINPFATANHPTNTPDCPSSKHLGLLSLFQNGGSGSSWFDVKPLGVDGSSS
jgi:hypothetical protein